MIYSVSLERAHKSHLVFSALETYSLVGGMQNFNRRVIRSLVSRTKIRKEALPQIQVLRDGSSVPKALSPFVQSYPSRFVYTLASAFAARRASVFIIGHINLLPLAALVRFLHWKTPILLFVHGDEVWNEPGRRKKRWFESLLLCAVDRIASVSRYTADIMSREFHVDAAKFRILPNAVDLIERSTSIPRTDSHIVLTVSRLGSGDRPKNIDQMLKAIAILKQRLPNVRYEIVGDGSLRSELEGLARELDISNNVAFLGRVSEADLSQAYGRASVFAMPSSKEGFGIVYLEAWLRSLPVICSSFGASKEVVSDGSDGFVVDHRRPEDIASRLYALLVDTELARRLGENGRKKVELQYLNNSFQDNLDAIIDDLLAPPGKHPSSK
ncbi:glycosyltransferase family 4 protein [Bradyrhizobium sp. 159]|uniref:glycosyltransferase family 4 protein n=1 Tax=Bradyrhizobium sp. 159 TaxID=2782632 RepID=UPI001FFA7D84|nr:glycosyltransferase family 4 protein [Bradyrhizobium sp. 159]